MTPEQFQTALLDWYDRAGRRGLPWQRQRTPYRVWVSEVMLQQTQVTTVIPYFQRFVAAFPNVETLANADLDHVLTLWSGLGYYSRARNLHRAACQVVENYRGELPRHLDDLMKLPGIGRSTAGAIVSLAFNQPAPILDGNVKRLWCRLHGIDTWPGAAATRQRLWRLSETYLPQQRAADYTQALMDFGATVCTKKQPGCQTCPFQIHCRALQNGQVDNIPVSRTDSSKPCKSSYWLILQNKEGAVYLEQRPATGIWAGLWAFPEWDSRQTLEHHCRQIGVCPSTLRWLSPRRHTFTHFHLKYVPALARVTVTTLFTLNDRPTWWIQPAEKLTGAFPTPVRKLLAEIGTAADSP